MEEDQARYVGLVAMDADSAKTPGQIEPEDDWNGQTHAGKPLENVTLLAPLLFG